VSSLQPTDVSATTKQFQYRKEFHCSHEQRPPRNHPVHHAPLVNHNISSNGQLVRVKNEQFSKITVNDETVFGREQRRENGHQRPGGQQKEHQVQQQPSSHRVEQLQPFDLRLVKREQPSASRFAGNAIK